MTRSFNRTSPETISRAAVGSYLYTHQKDAAAMTRIGQIAYVQVYEEDDGRGSWSQYGATVEFTNGYMFKMSDRDTVLYYLLKIDQITPGPKTEPNLNILRSEALRAANKVVGAQLDSDLRPENPNGAAAIEIAEAGFDKAVLALAKGLDQ